MPITPLLGIGADGYAPRRDRDRARLPGPDRPRLGYHPIGQFSEMLLRVTPPVDEQTDDKQQEAHGAGCWDARSDTSVVTKEGRS